MQKASALFRWRLTGRAQGMSKAVEVLDRGEPRGNQLIQRRS
jgi:hypothetical protein